uniref:Uncharacterized protein n=1 Tax=Romanomermis culicivorax TaxID=13658 RepID=A0A915K1Q5_ROMCU
MDENLSKNWAGCFRVATDEQDGSPVLYLKNKRMAFGRLRPISCLLDPWGQRKKGKLDSVDCPSISYNYQLLLIDLD